MQAGQVQRIKWQVAGMTKKHILFTTLFALSGLPAVAAPIHWIENGHYYEAVSRTATWNESRALATRSLGYLVTVGDAGENSLAFGLVDAPEYWSLSGNTQIGPWIGGMQADGAAEPDGGWKWVTGEPLTYTAWRDGEPNNVAGGEDRLNFMGEADAGRGAFWNDAGGGSNMLGFVVEWDDLPSWRFGDFDHSGLVDLSDFGLLKANFGTGTTPLQGNANFDDTVDLSDFGILKANFRTSPSVAATSAPEPASWLLAVVGAGLALAIRWAKRTTR